MKYIITNILILIFATFLLSSCESSKIKDGHYTMVHVDDDGYYDIGFRRAFQMQGERGEMYRKYYFDKEDVIEGTNFRCKKSRISIVELNNGNISIDGSPNFPYKITDYGFEITIKNETAQYHYLGDLMTPSDEIYLLDSLVEYKDNEDWKMNKNAVAVDDGQ